jgi:hypothetical protein
MSGAEMKSESTQRLGIGSLCRRTDRNGLLHAVLSLRYDALEVHPGAGFKERNRVGEILTSDVQALKAEQTGVAEKAATCWWVAVYSADAHSLLRGIARDPTSFTKRIGAVP